MVPNSPKYEQLKAARTSSLKITTRVVRLTGLDVRACGLVLVGASAAKGPVFIDNVIRHGVAHQTNHLEPQLQIVRVDDEPVLISTPGMTDTGLVHCAVTLVRCFHHLA